ncbi:MAG: hypothetical protein VYC11_02220 [Candidatus Thermoplasmatota archaeon]|nr:hypothetical protein [Candidatus Thermoplasmatota archaeon]MED5486474.1 hypothetical protein [Candidatus Thermoplasmatota archaeon]
MPSGWWLLMSLCSFFGVLTWYLRNFTNRDDMLRISAFTGIACMLSLLFWTLSMDL